MNPLDRLLARVEHGGLVRGLSLADDQIDAALDQRDQPQFEAPWLHAYHQIERRKGGKLDADPRVYRLRELVFLQTCERWKSPDLAGAISDDFGLFGDALATAYHDPWLNGLLDAYLDQRFPCADVVPRGGSLAERL